MKTISSCDSMRSTRENEKVFTDILRKRSKDQRHHTEIKGNTDLISETCEVRNARAKRTSVGYAKHVARMTRL